MSNHNIKLCFHGKIRKILIRYPLLSRSMSNIYNIKKLIKNFFKVYNALNQS